jgi:hypothetical protein
MNDYIPAAEMKNLFPNTSDQYWATLRHRGTGPTYAKIARKVYYRRVDLDQWITANLFTRPDKPVTATGGVV